MPLTELRASFSPLFFCPLATWWVDPWFSYFFLLSNLYFPCLIPNHQCLTLNCHLVGIQSPRTYGSIMLLLIRMWECGNLEEKEEDVWGYSKDVWEMVKSCRAGHYPDVLSLTYIAHILKNLFKTWNHYIWTQVLE